MGRKRRGNRGLLSVSLFSPFSLRLFQVCIALRADELLIKVMIGLVLGIQRFMLSPMFGIEAFMLRTVLAGQPLVQTPVLPPGHGELVRGLMLGV